MHTIKARSPEGAINKLANKYYKAVYDFEKVDGSVYKYTLTDRKTLASAIYTSRIERTSPTEFTIFDITSTTKKMKHLYEQSKDEYVHHLKKQKNYELDVSVPEGLF